MVLLKFGDRGAQHGVTCGRFGEQPSVLADMVPVERGTEPLAVRQQATTRRSRIGVSPVSSA